MYDEFDSTKYKCGVCGYEYDPEKGDPSQGIYPGTPFDELPATVSYTHLTLPTKA